VTLCRDDCRRPALEYDTPGLWCQAYGAGPHDSHCLPAEAGSPRWRWAKSSNWKWLRRRLSVATSVSWPQAKVCLPASAGRTR